MQELIGVTGIILKTEPIGEYDRRVVILTRERGKISAFARGARKQGSRLLASTNPFCFGKFSLYPGKSAYNVSETLISNYFDYTRENNDEKEMLKLLYQSLRALLHEGLSNLLVRYIFEIKALTINGEYPGLPKRDTPYLDSTEYTVNYIVNTTVEKLYTFTVTGQVLEELSQIAGIFNSRFIDKKMKSLEILHEIHVEIER